MCPPSYLKEHIMLNNSIGFSSKFKTKVIRAPEPALSLPKGPGLSWKLKQYSRLDFLFGLLAVYLARLFSAVTGITVIHGRLTAVRIRADGSRVSYGLLSRRLVTTAFVEFVVDQLQAETSIFGDFKYHDSGVGTTAASVGDTDIETTDGESRATGSQTEGASANIYKSVGTIAYTSTKAITEHGLFNASSGVTLMDRHVFSAINVDNGDSIQFSYELTVAAGG
jgi:hypothetical protein